MSHRIQSLLHGVLLALVLLPYFLNLGQASLWDSNEAFYAETPREMLESGDYVIPRFNYTFRWQKPPLTYWIVAASYRLFGISEWAERFPIALAAGAWIILCYWIGRRWFGAATALPAAIILGVNFRVFIMAHRAITEIGLSLFISLALILLGLVLIERPRCRRALLAAAYTCLGLATMTKGPVALAVVGGVVLCYQFWKRQWNPLKGLSPLLGLALLGIIICPWYARVVSIVGWNPVLNFILSDNLGRYLSEEFGPSRGIFYYVFVCLGDFFPWSLLSLTLLVTGSWTCVTRRDKSSEGLHDPDEILHRPDHPAGDSRDILGWLTIWVSVILLFFSLSKNKQEYYILPLYLPAALLMAHALAACVRMPVWKRRLMQGLNGVIGLSIASLGLAALLFLRNLFLAMPEWQVRFLGLTLLAGGAWIGVAAFRNHWRQCLTATVCSLWVGMAALPLILMPQWEAYKPVREFSQWITSHRRPGDYAGYYKFSAPSLTFYLREPIFEIIREDQLIHFLSNSRRRIFCIIEQDRFEAIRDQVTQRFNVIASRPVVGLKAWNLTRPLDLADRPQLLLISNSP